MSEENINELKMDVRLLEKKVNEILDRVTIFVAMVDPLLDNLVDLHRQVNLMKQKLEDQS